jgi:hypothetical protein
MILRFLLSLRIIHVIIIAMIPMANTPPTAPPTMGPKLRFEPEPVVPKDVPPVLCESEEVSDVEVMSVEGLEAPTRVVVDTAVAVAVAVVGVVVTFAPLLPCVVVVPVVPASVVCAATLSGKPAVLQYPSYAVTALENSPSSPQAEVMHVLKKLVA